MAAPSREAISHQKSDPISDLINQAKSRAEEEAACEESAGEDADLPLMADIMSGPQAPLTKAFLMANWRAIPIDRVFGEHHDLSDVKVQIDLHKKLKKADFVWAAFACDTKSRIREIPSRIPGKNLPGPLRSEEHPMGLPELQGSDKERVSADNDASEFVLAELKLHQERGGGSGSENPKNSLHWHTPSEVARFQGGTYWDTFYEGCSLQGARCKRQKIRHDIEEIQCWPSMKCRHIHHPEEWTPMIADDGAISYPSHEEAEYTACLVFHIVRAASMWACRVGRAVMKIPRAPPVETIGDRISWLKLDSRATREWAMIPMALSIGLNIGKFVAGKAADILPVRKVMQPTTKGDLGERNLYVGQGHYTHRQPTSKWATPFWDGQHGTKEECLIKYGEHLRESGLIDEVWKLRGHSLWCDCPYSEPCVADILIAAVYEDWQERDEEPEENEPRKRPARTNSKRWVGKALTAFVATSGDIGRAAGFAMTHLARQQPITLSMELRWPQEAVTKAFEGYYPEGFFDGFSFPFIEDIINSPPFMEYANWRSGRGEVLGVQQPPQCLDRVTVRKARGGQGIQLGAFSQKGARPPIVSFGLSPDEHFAASKKAASEKLPTEAPCTIDQDLTFAAEMVASRRSTIKDQRQRAVEAVRKLKRKWRSVTGFLRRKQVEATWKVTRERDIGLIPLLALLLVWPDVHFGYHLIVGFPAVGHNEWCGVFPRREVSPSERHDIFEDAEENNKKLLKKMRPGKDDDVILEKSMQDVDKGFAEEPMKLTDLQESLQGAKVRFIRRFVITQSTGKKRIIDDAADGGQSEVSTDENALCFCSAMQPAHHVEAVKNYMDKEDIPWPQGEEGCMQTTGEDWPDAYRYTPMKPEEAEACIVIWWHPVWKCIVAQRYYGLPFGLPNAVTSFNRWSKMAEAILRRLIMVLLSKYFDDATLQDWADQIEDAKRCANEIMQLLGSPWAKEKSQPCQERGDFLGLIHDLSEVREGIIHFWPREALVVKVRDIIGLARKAGIWSGTAAKLYGVSNFLETGMFARVGRAGLAAIKDRQYSDETDITPEIIASFDLLEDLFRMQPRREYRLAAGSFSRFLVASDAAYENGRGSAGFLVVINPGRADEIRIGKVIDLPVGLYALWGEKKTYIAQLELIAVFVAMVEVASLIRRSHGLWFIDNVAALMALVKGSSKTSSLDQIAKATQLGCFALEIQSYYEYVESKANWSDEISRLGSEGPWAIQNHFQIKQCQVAIMLLQLPCIAIAGVFAFL